MNQIISVETLEREELALFERKAKENVARRQAEQQAQVELKALQEQEMKEILQRAQERQAEHEAATLAGAVGGVALALGCVTFDALWVLLIALGWVLGVAWKAMR